MKQIKNFKLPSSDDKIFNLKNENGYIVIYFYPKNFTSGCSIQAIDFKKKYKNFKKNKCEIIGISADTIDSHKKFINKYNIPFRLLSDEKKKIIKKLRVWGKKSMYGNHFYGIKRTTYLLDPKKKVLKKWNNVKVKNHVNEVFKTLTLNK